MYYLKLCKKIITIQSSEQYCYWEISSIILFLSFLNTAIFQSRT